ncbi:BTAD domain-containing putative transcriptional regulator [Streptomyces sp. NPDC090106]|uniref:BTAD domain-containing putative transcriptional regulator n=1 Tax=Streptomyces sp. NPDC090106 TaxID=3365946 RepID=UPI0037FD2432
MSAEFDGEPIDLGTPRQRAILSMLLAARGSVVPVDRLVDGVWRDVPPAKAPASLHAYISNLRRVLEPNRPPRSPATVLATAPPGYLLRLGPDAVDAWRFETAVRRARDEEPARARSLLAGALGTWQGPPFAEHEEAGWAAAEVARLTELRAEARELAIACDIRTGNAAQAAADAGTLVREHPLREEGWRLLALAQWAGDRRADALSTLRRAARTFRDELACEPGPALAELEDAVLNGRLDVLRAAAAPSWSRADEARPRHSVAAAHAPAAHATAPAPAAHSPAAHTADHPPLRELFVGRAAELRTAAAAIGAARQGGGMLVVTGEPGAGKSALVAHLAQRLRGDGWTVLVGRCPEYEGAPPAWSWSEMLRELAQVTPPKDPEELAALLHEHEHVTPPHPDDAATSRFRMHRAFAAWLRAAASAHPIALVVEDLHRADSEALALLETATDITGVPLLTVVTYRPAETGEHLVKTLAHVAPRAPHRLTLDGLPAQDVATLVRTVCGDGVDAATMTALAERTGGNPFYVLESARLLASEGALVATSEVPQGVRDVLRRRLAKLPARARSAVQLTAAMGMEADVSVLAAASDTTEDDLLEGLDDALTARLLVEPRPGRVRFEHALVRDTVYTDLSGIRRARLHNRLADVLRRHRPDDLAALAHHYARSGSTANAPAAVDYALRAAEAAERRYAHEIAAVLIEQAIEVRAAAGHEGADDGPEHTVGLLVRLLGAQVRAGSTDAARHTRRRAVELAERAGRGDLVAAVYGAWTEPSPWHSRLGTKDDDAVLRRIDELASDPDLDDASRIGMLQTLVATVAPTDARRAARMARTQLLLARTNGEPRLLAAALMTSAQLLPHEVRGAERTPLVAELRELARTHDLPAYRWVCERLDALTAATVNDPAAVVRHTAEGLSLAHRYRMVWAQGLDTATSAMLAAVQGRFEDAEAQYIEADKLLQRVGAHKAQGLHTLGMATIRLAQGRPREIEPVMRALYDTVGAPVGILLALALLLMGRPDEARAVQMPEQPVTDHLYGIELDFRARLAVLEGDAEEAALLVGHLLPLGAQFAGTAGGAYATRPLAHALADLYRLLGEGQAAADHYALAYRTARIWSSPHSAEAARRAATELTAARSPR